MLAPQQVAKILSCIKVGCIATGSTAAIVAGGVTFDTLIEKSVAKLDLLFLYLC